MHNPIISTAVTAQQTILPIRLFVPFFTISLFVASEFILPVYAKTRRTGALSTDEAQSPQAASIINFRIKFNNVKFVLGRFRRALGSVRRTARETRD